MSREILAIERLRPLQPLQEPKTVALSIIDTGYSNFTPTGAIWLFEKSPLEAEALLEHLKTSLQRTLQSFPHFAGQLHRAAGNKNGAIRPMVTYGSAQDPGIEWTTARVHKVAAELVPNGSERVSKGVWVGTGFPQGDLMASMTATPLDVEEGKGLPAFMAQGTILDNGGYAVAVKVCHALSDAAVMALFVKHWAAQSRILHGSTSTDLPPAPVFDPSLLDGQASGDLDNPTPDPEIVAQAAALPLARCDWTFPTPSATREPSPEQQSTSGDDSFADSSSASLANSSSEPVSRADSPSTSIDEAPETDGRLASWADCDFSKPAPFGVVSFTSSQVNHLKALARQQNPSTSRLDATLAHLWSGIARARNLHNDEGTVQLICALQTRPKTTTPLPATFVGCPVLVPSFTAQGSKLADSTPGASAAIASTIRSNLKEFTPSAVGAYIHAASYMADPDKMWVMAMGHRASIVTSWMHGGQYGVSFFGSEKENGEGERPRYVHPLFSTADGFITVMDGADGKGGIDFCVLLDEGVLERLSQDAHLLPQVA